MVTKTCYRSGLKRMKRGPTNLFCDYHLPSFWLDWGKKQMARHLSTSVKVTPRQSLETWTAFAKLAAPTIFLEYLRLALWRKLPVGERLDSWLKNGGFCPFHNELESIDHSLTSCLYSKVVVSFVSTVYPTVKVDVLSDPEGSLSHPADLLTWTGLASHWHMRCAYKKNSADTQTPTLTLNHFLHM